MTTRDYIGLVKRTKISLESKYFYVAMRVFVNDKSNNTYIVFNRKLNNIYRNFSGYNLEECEFFFKELKNVGLIEIFKSLSADKNTIYTIKFL